MSDLVCKVEEGALRGRVEKDMDGHLFLSFMGIPYAKPPLGPLRFKPPQPVEKWLGVLDARTEGSPCFSLHVDLKGLIPRIKVKGSEDCLFLNVYTHQLLKYGSEKLHPVMVFIHGGAFVSGSCSRDTFGPEYLMTEDIVLVLMNYRLGALGFLSMKDPSLEATGNMGLKDQILALKWVQKNIKQFCGDPSNVTLLGQSAGSASVHYLVLSPQTKGLFHKAIMQSGTATCPWARGRNDIEQLTKYSKCPQTDEMEMFKCLQNITVEKLLNAQNKDFFKVRGPGAKSHFGPTIEVKNPTAVITEEPLKLINSGAYNHMPLMFGYTNLEGILGTWGSGCQRKKVFEDLLPYSFGYDKNSEKFLELNRKIIQFYYGKNKADSGNTEIAAKLFTDVTFLRGIFQSVKAHARTCHKPVYLYRVSLETELNAFKKMLRFKSAGVCHGDDVCYLFKTRYTKYKPHTIEEISIRRFVKMWTNFAQNSDPLSWKNPFLNTYWYPISNHFNFLDIGRDLIPGIDPEFDNITFWEEISKGVTEQY